MDKAMIEVKGLSKRYGKFEAVKGLSFSVRRGEVFGFLGPNGAGKTTTLKMITGLLKPSEGSVFIGGRSMMDEPLVAKGMLGFIPDRPYVYEKLTAVEFMRFVASLHKMEAADVAERVGELLSLFELSQWGGHLIENFSHGMKQRLVVATALLPRPKLLVVDEPMVGLDPKGARLIKSIFRKICSDAGMTVFLSTHTLEVAEELCDRIAIIQGGEIVVLGTLEEIREGVGGEGSLETMFLKITAGEEGEGEARRVDEVIANQVKGEAHK